MTMIINDTIAVSQSATPVATARTQTKFLEMKTSSITSSSSSVKKSVCFYSIDIYEFPIQLGEGSVPTHNGAPLGIGWEWTRHRNLSVDEYESERGDGSGDGGEGRQRRTREQFCLSSKQRTQILLDQGCSMREIIAATIQCSEIRMTRKVSSKPSHQQRCKKLLQMSWKNLTRRSTTTTTKTASTTIRWAKAA